MSHINPPLRPADVDRRSTPGGRSSQGAYVRRGLIRIGAPWLNTSALETGRRKPIRKDGFRGGSDLCGADVNTPGRRKSSGCHGGPLLQIPIPARGIDGGGENGLLTHQLGTFAKPSPRGRHRLVNSASWRAREEMSEIGARPAVDSSPCRPSRR